MITAISIILYGMSATAAATYGANLHSEDRSVARLVLSIAAILFTLAAALQVWSVWP